MKKVLLTALATLYATGLYAAPVTAERAKTTATVFMKGMTGRNMTVKDVAAENGSYYIINMAQGGWVIVSADDTATPVLGYNTSGRLDWHSLPGNMQNLLSGYAGEMKAMLRHGVKTQNKVWAEMSHPGAFARSRAAEGEISPLITVNWDQTSPYNYYCPGSGSSKAVVGCVAVSMSQAMSVQRYPNQPQGQMSYACSGYGQLSLNYDAEKAYNWDNILSGANDNNETARLLYHAGVSVQMGYGADASGIPSNLVSRIPNALAATFGYNADDLKYFWRNEYEKTGDWTRLVLNELNAGRAVIYNAADSKGNYGHSFNVDGYDGRAMFHLNWGWGGVGNGYFTLDNLTDLSMDMNYDTGHVVVTGIGSPDQVLKSITLTDEIIDEQMPAGTVMAQVLVNGEEPLPTYSIELYGAYDPLTGSYAEIPFELKNGLIVTKSVLSAREEPIEVNIRVTDSATNTRLVSSFNITVCKLRSIAQATSMSFNRNTGEIQIRTRNGVNYTVTGKNGATLKSGSLTPVPHLTINMSELDEGDNVLTLSADGSSKSITIRK